MKYLKVLISTALIVISYSCDPSRGIKRDFIIMKTDDKNWSNSGRIEVDSVDMVSENHVIYWIDGRKFNLRGGIIKIYSKNLYGR